RAALLTRERQHCVVEALLRLGVAAHPRLAIDGEHERTALEPPQAAQEVARQRRQRHIVRVAVLGAGAAQAEDQEGVAQLLPLQFPTLVAATSGYQQRFEQRPPRLADLVTRPPEPAQLVGTADVGLDVQHAVARCWRRRPPHTHSRVDRDAPVLQQPAEHAAQRVGHLAATGVRDALVAPFEPRGPAPPRLVDQRVDMVPVDLADRPVAPPRREPALDLGRFAIILWISQTEDARYLVPVARLAALLRNPMLVDELACGSGKCLRRFLARDDASSLLLGEVFRTRIAAECDLPPRLRCQHARSRQG